MTYFISYDPRIHIGGWMLIAEKSGMNPGDWFIVEQWMGGGSILFIYPQFLRGIITRTKAIPLRVDLHKSTKVQGVYIDISIY